MSSKAMDSKIAVKVIGANGQISLGKEFAGKQVLVEMQEPGVWWIRTATVIPENESWLHRPKAKRDLQRSISWAVRHLPSESDPIALAEKLEHAQKSKQRPSSARSK